MASKAAARLDTPAATPTPIREAAAEASAAVAEALADEGIVITIDGVEYAMRDPLRLGWDGSEVMEEHIQAIARAEAAKDAWREANEKVSDPEDDFADDLPLDPQIARAAGRAYKRLCKWAYPDVPGDVWRAVDAQPNSAFLFKTWGRQFVAAYGAGVQSQAEPGNASRPR